MAMTPLNQIRESEKEFRESFTQEGNGYFWSDDEVPMPPEIANHIKSSTISLLKRLIEETKQEQKDCPWISGTSECHVYQTALQSTIDSHKKLIEELQ